MRKPNWKQRGFSSAAAAVKFAEARRTAEIRRAKLNQLPPEIRKMVEKQPQLERFIP